MRRFKSRPAAAHAAPLPEIERNTSMDVLRGLAIIGVMIANYTQMISYGVVATDRQILALPSVELDAIIDFCVTIFVTDKASTTLSFLFGLGFFLLCRRLEDKGALVIRLYLQRLAALLVLGLVHLFLLWTWDILTIYAFGGLILLMTRGWRPWMVLALAVLILAFEQYLFQGSKTVSDVVWSVSEADVDYEYPIRRLQAYSEAGDYLSLVAYFGQDTLVSFQDGYILSGIIHMSAFMLLGAFVGQTGILEKLTHYRGQIGLVALVAIPVGIWMELWVYGAINELIDYGFTESLILNAVFNVSVIVSVPLTALGYICVVLYLLQWRLSGRILSMFAPLGRMALTNYVMQSAFAGFVLFGVGPGLALAGSVGSSYMLAAGLCFVVFQMGYSYAWLTYFSHGPLEWAWRKLTYAGQAPRQVRMKVASAKA